MKLHTSVAFLLSGTSVAVQSERQTPLASVLPAAASSADADAPSYRDELVSLHKSLVEISSISYSENEVGTFLVDYLKGKDFTTELQTLPSSNTSGGDGKPRFNVLAWPGSERHSSPKVLVTSHIDTVPPHIPYSRSDDEPNGETVISGRGSVDAKASVAAQITAVAELMAAGSIDPADVMLLYVVGEERGGDGMVFFSDSLAVMDPPGSVGAAIFGEPTEGKLACGHKGIFSCTITAHGKAGHSGYPWLGKSANEVLMRALIKVLDADLGSSELFGNTTVNVGQIEGGVALNVIPELAVAGVTGRVAIGPESDGARIVIEKMQDILSSVDDEAFETECISGYGVIECACDVPDFETTTVNYGTDIPHLKGNHTRYLYGPGSILVAHGADEAIKLKDLEAGVEDYKKIILHAVADEEVKKG